MPYDKKEILVTNIPEWWLRQLANVDAMNPFEMVCNPYNTTNTIIGGLT